MSIKHPLKVKRYLRNHHYVNKLIVSISILFTLLTNVTAQNANSAGYYYDYRQFQIPGSRGMLETKNSLTLVWGITGLHEFNGKSFKRLRLLNDNPSFPINSAISTSNGKVFLVGIENDIYEKAGDTLTYLTTIANRPKDFRVNVLYEMGGNRYLLGTSKGLYIYEYGAQAYEMAHHSLLNELFASDIFDIIQYNNHYFLSTNNGLYETDFQKFLKKWPIPINSSYLRNRFSKAADKQNGFWLSLDKLYYFNGVTFQLINNLPTTGTSYSKIFYNSVGLAFTASGHHIYTLQNNKVIDSIDINYNNLEVINLFLDSFDHLWVEYSDEVTYREYYKLPFRLKKFKKVNNLYIETIIDSAGHIIYIENNSGNIVSMDPNSGENKILFKNTKFPKEQLLTLTRRKDERLMVFLRKDGKTTNACWVDNNKIIPIPSSDTNIRYVNVSEPPVGNTYFSTMNHGTCYLNEKGVITPLFKNTFVPHNSIVVDKWGGVWSSGFSGVTYEYQHKIVQLETRISQLKQNISQLIVWDKYIYLGTGQGELIILQTPKLGEVELVHYYKQDDGLPEGEVYKMRVDSEGNLLMWTGLKSFVYISRPWSPAASLIFPISNEVLQSLQIADPEVMELLPNGNGMIIFNGLKLEFNKNDFKQWIAKKPAVILRKVQLFNRDIDWKARGYQFIQSFLPDSVKLKYDENFITFYFEGIQSEGMDVRFKYWLKGIDKDWLPSTEQSSASYNNLSPGNYVFYCSASSNGSGWSKPVSFSFTILQPWYKTWWATLIWLLLIGLVLSLLIAYFIQRQKIYISNRVRESREELLRIIAHDLRSPINSYQKIAESIAFLYKQGDYKAIDEIGLEITATGKRLSFLLTNLLQWGIVLQSKGMKPDYKKVDVRFLFDEVTATYSDFITQSNLKLNITNEVNSLIKSDKDMLGLIIRNLLDNSIKNADQNTTIEVVIKQVNDDLYIEFKNSTKKIDFIKLKFLAEKLALKEKWEPGRDGMGLGLYMVSRYLNMMNGTLHLKYEENTVVFSTKIVGVFSK